jgi:hypothetical protein
MLEDWTLIGFGAAVLIASLPAIITVFAQGRFNVKQVNRQNDFFREQERTRNEFEIERERREEQREREKMLWQLEFDKFQKLENFLNELVYSVHNRPEDAEAIRRRLWLTIELFSLGFPNYPDIAQRLYEIEALYLTAKQNQGVDYLRLREHCIDIVKSCRTALMVGLPITVIEGQQVTSKLRSYS